MAVLHNASFHPQLGIYQTSCFFEDFYNYTTAGLFTTVAGSTGTSVADDTNGTDVLLATTAATSNDAQGVKTTKSNFLFTSGNGYFCNTQMSFTNQASNNGAFYFGFSSSGTFNGNATAVPSASYSGAVIYKLGGETVWRVQTSNGSAKVDSTSVQSAVDGAYNLRIDISDWDSLNAMVTFRVGPTILTTSNNQVITHKLPYASLVKMGVVALGQAGSANAQAVSFDYITASKYRGLN